MNFPSSPPSPKHNTSLVWNLCNLGWVLGRQEGAEPWWSGEREEVSPRTTSPTSEFISVNAAVLLEDSLREEVREPPRLAQGHWSWDNFIKSLCLSNHQASCCAEQSPTPLDLSDLVPCQEDWRMGTGNPGKWKAGWEGCLGAGVFFTTRPVLGSSSSDLLILHLHAHPFLFSFFLKLLVLDSPWLIILTMNPEKPCIVGPFLPSSGQRMY